MCSWLDSVASTQNSGNSAHPDDLRAGTYIASFPGFSRATTSARKASYPCFSLYTAQRIARSLDALMLHPDKPEYLAGQVYICIAVSRLLCCTGHVITLYYDIAMTSPHKLHLYYTLAIGTKLPCNVYLHALITLY